MGWAVRLVGAIKSNKTRRSDQVSEVPEDEVLRTRVDLQFRPVRYLLADLDHVADVCVVLKSFHVKHQDWWRALDESLLARFDDLTRSCGDADLHRLRVRDIV